MADAGYKASYDDPRSLESMLMAGLAAGQVGVWHWHASTGQIEWSPNLEGIHGLRPGSFNGSFGFFERDIHPDDREGVLAAIRVAMEAGGPYCVRYRLPEADPDGQDRWLEARGEVTLSDGVAVGMHGVCQDITERIRTEQELRTRARQQEVVARLGQLALRETSLDTLFHAVAAEVAGTLGVEYGKILELSPDRQTLRFRAGHGWQQWPAGGQALPADDGSLSAYTLKTLDTVVVDDYAAETRFTGPSSLFDRPVASGICTVIFGEEGRPFGVISAHSQRQRSFGQRDIDFLRAVANILAAAIQHAHGRERQMLLMRELRHRVGNLLTLVLSLFNNSARNARSVDDLLDKFVARVMSLSRAHTHLSYGGWSTASLSRIVREALEPFLDRIPIEGTDITVTADSAFALSLALHELATNAAKHGGLSLSDGGLRLSWKIDLADSKPQLRFTWQERGLTRLAPPRRSGFGSRLVNSVVCDQLGGTATFDYSAPGLTVEIALPLDRILPSGSSRLDMPF